MDSAGSDRGNAINGPLHSGYTVAQAKGPSKEERLHFQSLLFDAVGQALIATDLQGNVIHWNRGAENLYGWSAKEVMGRSIMELTPSEELIERAEEIMAELLAGRSWSGELMVRRKDGTTFPAMVIDTPVHDEQGNLIAIIGVSTDITEIKHTEELRRSEELFRLLAENAQDIIYRYRYKPTPGFEYVSPSAASIVGYTPEEYYADPELGIKIAHPDDRHLLEEVLRHPESSVTIRSLRKDGEVVWTEQRNKPIYDEAGELVAIEGIARDVTETKKAHEALKESEERFRLVVEGVKDYAIFILDDQGHIITWNEGARRTTGYEAQEIIGKHFSVFYPEEDVRRGKPEVGLRVATQEEGVYEKEEGIRIRKDGSEFWANVLITALRDQEGNLRGFSKVVRDITERKALEEHLKHRATHDPLTNLPNRTLLMDRLEHALRHTSRRSRRSVAVLFVDLDNFKAVNDSLGHEVGDRLLVAVSERLRGRIRQEDTLARFGGDEFIVLLEEVEDSADAIRVVERITEAFREPIVLDGSELFVRISIGVGLGSSRTKSAEDLLQDADTAMYRAKAEGMDYRVFNPDMYLRAISRLELENDLRRAIEAEEFVLHYQPIVNLESSEVRGVEALVRWNHPERGLLGPQEFVSVAEESGLIAAMGEQVLEEACRQAKEWQEEHPRIPPLIMMSVNLSARQLRRPDLATTVEEVLQRTGFEAACLSLDITETVYIKVLEGNIAALDELKRLGVKISIDDFGVGYSSLSYLKRLPADVLKIDKSFLKGIGEDVEDTAIVRMVIELAHTLGMEVIAEGVEGWTQAALLREMGCDMAQGFFFSKPLLSEKVSEFLAEGRTL